MKVEIAFDLNKTREISFQDEFPKTTNCCVCGGEARLGFVAHEHDEKSIQEGGKYVSQVHNAKGGLWLHDAMACAVYFCKKCLEPTALYNQA